MSCELIHVLKCGGKEKGNNMLFDILIDEVDDILAIRTALIKNNFVTTGGNTIVSWNSENTSVTKQWAISPARLLEETRAYLKAYDPDLYGKSIKKVLPQYTNNYI
jgi:hypothetical protein